MLKALSLVYLSSMAVQAAQFDPPDLLLEERLHRQYLNGGSQQKSAAESRGGMLENYSLQQGESLWGLSRMLYGDGNYWPRVWAQNQSIPNPHLIRKGHTLQFLMGNEDEAPAFRFSEGEDPAGLELAAANVQTNPQIQIPPPEIAPRPVLKVPNSFPEWQSVFREPIDRIEIDDSKSKLAIAQQKLADLVPLRAFVQENPVDSIGKFLEPEKESGLPVTNQYIYVKVKKGAARIGDRLLVVQDMGNIRKLNSQVEGEIHAHFIEVFGELELTETARSNFSKKSDNENFDVYRALVTRTMHLSITDYDLIPGRVDMVDVSLPGPSANVDAQVIGSQKMATSALYGPGDVVFLNQGSQAGLEVGQMLDLYIDRSIRDERTPVRFSNLPSGTMKIARVSTTCATGIILKSVDSIQQGDRAQMHAPASAKVQRDAEPDVFDLPGSEDHGSPPN